MTNVVRRMAMMQDTLAALQSEPGNMHSPAVCRWITDNTAWDATWPLELRGCGLVLVKWMGTGLDTPFLNQLLAWLKQYKVPYYIDAAGADQPELFNSFAEKRYRTSGTISCTGDRKTTVICGSTPMAC